MAIAMPDSRYDLLIHGGTVIDPAQGLHAALDVAFAAGWAAVSTTGATDEEMSMVVERAGREEA